MKYHFSSLNIIKLK